jgi:hypothetical protein
MVHFQMKIHLFIVGNFIFVCIATFLLACQPIKRKNINTNYTEEAYSHCFERIFHSIQIEKVVSTLDSSNYSIINLDSLISSNIAYTQVANKFKESSHYTESHILRHGNDTILILIGRAIGATAPMWNYECFNYSSSGVMRNWSYASVFNSVYSVFIYDGELGFIFIDEIESTTAVENRKRLPTKTYFVSLLRNETRILQFSYKCC